MAPLGSRSALTYIHKDSPNAVTVIIYVLADNSYQSIVIYTCKLTHWNSQSPLGPAISIQALQGQ